MNTHHNYKAVLDAMIEHLADYVDRYHLDTLVLGLSGGIDSTVVATIAGLTCRQHYGHRCQLIGVSLPSNTNQLAEVDSAQLVGQIFCDQFIQHSIEGLFQDCLKDFAVDLSLRSSSIANGNLKVRLRMMFLYNLASLTHGLVLDTSNRTEHQFGFWTVHGDVGDYNVGIVHLWKTEVYQLANCLVEQLRACPGLTPDNSRAIAAILSSIRLTPTDGNGVAGSDLEQIGGRTYQEVDEILRYCDDTFDGEESAMKSRLQLSERFDREVVDKILSRYHNSSFKRQKAPIAPSPEALGLM